jgi:hypothetical protein
MTNDKLLELTPQDLEIFISEIKNPKPPNEELKLAWKRYKFNLLLPEAEKAWERCEDSSQMDKKSFIKGYVSALEKDLKSDNTDSNIFCED